MTTSITFDVTGILTMAVLAVLIAALIPLRSGSSVLSQIGRGVGRALGGCALAAAAWICIQVAGGMLEDRIAPKWASSPIITPIPGPAAAQPPGHDI